MKNRFVLISIVLIIFLASCDLSLAEDITPPPGYVAPTVGPTLGALFPSSAPSPANGQLIYAEKCEPCHGVKGLGNGPQASGVPVPVSAIGLRDISSQYNPAKWYTVITQGQLDRYMPPFTSLSESERWDVLSYVYTLSNTSSLVEQGSVIFAAQCAECHGVNGDVSTGKNSNSGVDFLDQQFMSQVTGLGLYQSIANGIQPGMPAFSSSLTDADIWALTAYLRTLTYDLDTQVALVPSATVIPDNTIEPSSSPALTQTSGTQEPTSGVIEPGSESTATEIPAVESTLESTTVPTSTIPVGKVSGTITNGSGGKLPENLVVNLLGYVYMDEVINLTTTANPDGSFEFTNVPLEQDVALVVTAELGDITYNTDFSVYDGTISEFDLPLTIYDTTSDNSTISADRVHMFFDFSNPGSVQVIEIYILSNSGNLAVVPAGKGESVQNYILPAGASNLVFETGDIGNPYIQNENGFGDPSAIFPGSSTYQLLFAFQLPYDKKITIDQPITMDIGSIIVMTPEGIEISSDQLTSAGSRDVQGQVYTMFTGENLKKGDSISFVVSGKVKNSPSTTSSDDSQQNLIIGLGAFGLALILAALFFYLKSRKPSGSDEPEYEEDETDSLGNDADALMDAINSLDDQFKAGLIKEEAYKIRRDELKSRLKEIL
ncbi:MAG TPA: c-type cytochrome [Anaerolineales bacterium]|nr:c-type cytochrome [Anaerolineales bacterium]